MANIGAMPTGADLLAGTDVQAEYGDRLRWEREGEDKVHLLTTENSELIATSSIHAAYVYLERLQPLLVPYVNAFIAHTNQRVEKYWRTKSYRIMPLEPAPRGAAADELAPNVRAAQALNLLAPRQVSEAAQMRAFGQMLIKAAECLEAEEARRLAEERDALREEPIATR